MATVYIFEEELRRIGEMAAAVAAAWPTIETGGALFGYWTHTGAPVVHLASGPGPAAQHRATSFHQDAEFLEACQATLFGAFALQHIGEWHSHHSIAPAEPSGGDTATVWSGMEAHGFQTFALGICAFQDRDPRRVEVAFFLFDQAAGTWEECEVRTLEGASPLRAAASGLPAETDWTAPEGVAVRPTYAFGELAEDHVDVDEVAGGSWFSAPELAERLADEIHGLRLLQRETGAEGGLVPEGETLVMRIELDDRVAEARLGPGFPERAPAIALDGELATYAWDPDDLVAAAIADLLVADTEPDAEEPG